jgi:hypothetical protein
MLNESFYCENAPVRGHDHIVIDMCTFYKIKKMTIDNIEWQSIVYEVKSRILKNFI